VCVHVRAAAHENRTQAWRTSTTATFIQPLWRRSRRAGSTSRLEVSLGPHMHCARAVLTQVDRCKTRWGR
jgi:hypothetical protein